VVFEKARHEAIPRPAGFSSSSRRRLEIFFGFPMALLGAQDTPFSKGTEDAGIFTNWLTYALAYLAMVGGMLSQYLYTWLTKAAGASSPFDWRSFLAPALVSPIIFVPLCGTIDTGEHAQKGALMLLLVAFENGFFFKSYFEARAKAAAGGP
jgi:hypothetical protein